MVNVSAVEDPDALLLVTSNKALRETENATATGAHRLGYESWPAIEFVKRSVVAYCIDRLKPRPERVG